MGAMGEKLRADCCEKCLRGHCVSGVEVPGACYYSPSGGRRPQDDPIGYDGGINLYSYAESSPVGAVDASGSKAVIEPVRYVPVVPGGRGVPGATVFVRIKKVVVTIRIKCVGPDKFNFISVDDSYPVQVYILNNAAMNAWLRNAPPKNTAKTVYDYEMENAKTFAAAWDAGERDFQRTGALQVRVGPMSKKLLEETLRNAVMHWTKVTAVNFYHRFAKDRKYNGLVPGSISSLEFRIFDDLDIRYSVIGGPKK